MKEFKSIKIDDKINTVEYGLVTVIDLFVSPRTGIILYKIETPDHEFTIACEDELYENPTNN